METNDIECIENAGKIIDYFGYVIWLFQRFEKKKEKKKAKTKKKIMKKANRRRWSTSTSAFTNMGGIAN